MEMSAERGTQSAELPGSAQCAVRSGSRTEGDSRRGVNTVTRQPPRTAHRVPIVLILLLAPLPSMAVAQTATTVARPWFAKASHYGKWVALAAAGGMLAQGALRHRDADREFEVVVDRCRATPALCSKAPTGEYQSAEMEALYQRTVRLDHRARGWLLAGEGLLLGAGAMFLVDLIYRDDAPRNIPFTPFTVFAQPGKLGFSIEF